MISRTIKHNIPILTAMDLEMQSTDSKQTTVLLMQEHPQKIDSAVSIRILMDGLTSTMLSQQMQHNTVMMMETGTVTLHKAQLLTAA